MLHYLNLLLTTVTILLLMWLLHDHLLVLQRLTINLLLWLPIDLLLRLSIHLLLRLSIDLLLRLSIDLLLWLNHDMLLLLSQRLLSQETRTLLLWLHVQSLLLGLNNNLLAVLVVGNGRNLLRLGVLDNWLLISTDTTAKATSHASTTHASHALTSEK